MLDFLVTHLFSLLGTVLGGVATFYVRQYSLAKVNEVANAAIQMAVANFAKATTPADPSLSLTTRLSDYLLQSVPDAVKHLAPSVTTLETMLAAKFKEIAAKV